MKEKAEEMRRIGYSNLDIAIELDVSIFVLYSWIGPQPKYEFNLSKESIDFIYPTVLREPSLYRILSPLFGWERRQLPAYLKYLGIEKEYLDSQDKAIELLKQGLSVPEASAILNINREGLKKIKKSKGFLSKGYQYACTLLNPHQIEIVQGIVISYIKREYILRTLVLKLPRDKVEYIAKELGHSSWNTKWGWAIGLREHSVYILDKFMQKRQPKTMPLKELTPTHLRYWFLCRGQQLEDGIHLHIKAFDEDSVNKLVTMLKNRGFKDIKVIKYFLIIKDHELFLSTIGEIPPLFQDQLLHYSSTQLDSSEANSRQWNTIDVHASSTHS